MEKLPEDWAVIRTSPFDLLIGPFFYPPDGDLNLCGFLADERHGNTRGIVHGGMIAPVFDVALGNASWGANERQPCATIQLNIHYVDAMNLGEFATLRSEIVRKTRTLVFARGVMTVGKRVIATADGIWKAMQIRQGDRPVPLADAPNVPAVSQMG